MSESNASAISGSSTGTDKPALEALRAAYLRADAFTREIQSFSEKAGIPAMNEMRYAGFHLLAALNDDGGVINSDELTRARNHAQRACYEAAEAGILFVLDAISRFKTQYELVNVSTVLPDYVDILTAAEEARVRLVQPRAKDSDRASDHHEFMATFKALRHQALRLEMSRPELNSLVARERRTDRRFVATIVIALLTLFGTLAAAVISFAALHPGASARPQPTDRPALSSLAGRLPPR